MKLRPLAGRVYVRVLQNAQTRSGLWLPEQRNERTLKVEVLEVGEGKPAPMRITVTREMYAVASDRPGSTWPRIPPQVKKGDVCLLPFYNRGGDIPEERDVLIVKEEELLAVVEGEE